MVSFSDIIFIFYPGAAMTPLSGSPARRSRLIKNIALCCLLSGFAFQIGGGVIADWRLFKVGIFLFLMALPLYLVGRLLGRRKP